MKIISKNRFKQILFSAPHYFAELKTCHDMREVFFWIYFKFPYYFPIPEFPVYLDIELTNECNLRCVHCLSQRNEKKRAIGFMDELVFKKIVDEFAAYENRNLLICGVGEPVLHPQIEHFLNYLSDMGIRHSFYTNGTFLKRFSANHIINWKIDTIVLSIDGLDNLSHKRIRIGSDYNEIKKNTSELYRLKQNQGFTYPRIEIRHVIFPGESNSELISFRNEWMKIADAVKFNFLIPPSGYKQVGAGNGMRRCRDIRRKMHVRWDGQVPICGYRYIHDDYEWLGNIRDVSIKELWNHARLKQIRNYHKQRAIHSITFCKECVFTQK